MRQATTALGLLLLLLLLLLLRSPSPALATSCEALACPTPSSAALDADEVPVIDVASLDEPSAQLVEELGRACKTWGFFQIVNHRVDATKLRERMTQFFELPLASKLAVKRTRANSRGFANDELTKQKVDWKEIFDFGHVPHRGLAASHAANAVMDGFNQWPRELQDGFERDLLAYYDACAALSAKLLRVLALSLGLDPGKFEACFEPHTSFQRLNHYPAASDAPPGTLGISRHTDAGALTLLWQDPGVASLQVYSGYKEDAKDGVWVTVRPLPGALTVNIGDMMHVFTGGRYAAPEHRVLANATHERYSAPFFYNPAYACLVRPLLEGGPQQFRAIPWGEFRAKRFEGDYADVGTETQIEHYLV